MEKLLDAMLAAFDAGNMEETNKLLEEIIYIVDTKLSTTIFNATWNIPKGHKSLEKAEWRKNKRIRKV